MREFELINHLQGIVNAGVASKLKPGSIGIGDDAAVLSVEQNRQLVVTTDTLVSGVHFPPESNAADIGYKALAVNLSDLAAMGADASWFFLALTLPAADEQWVEEFAAGLGALAASAGVPLVGGDTTSGPLSITITALGQVDHGAALLRSTARAGDLVVVSGTPGQAALGLAQFQLGQAVNPEAWRAFTRPDPRLKLGQLLRGKATACIDISDGLAADLGHIIHASGVGAQIWMDRLPQSGAMLELAPDRCWDLQLGGGDDYELCFTLPAGLEPELPELAALSGVGLSVIGQITAGHSLQIRQADGTEFVPERQGYVHFAGTSQ